MILTRKIFICRGIHMSTNAILLTRSQFFEQLKHAFTAHQNEQHNFAVLIVGVNRFKKINLLYGVEIGDKILETIAQRIRAILPEGNAIARIANCEFAILLNNLNHIGQVMLATNKILSVLGETFIFGPQHIQIKASIGIFRPHTNISRADDCVYYAEQALEQAKKNNEDYVLYSDEMDVASTSKTDLEAKINIALDEGEFELYYQPKVDLKTGLAVGAEALIRWNSSFLGQISPNDFIPIAEQTGQIIPITFWTLNTALRQLSEWPEMCSNLNVAINFSALVTKDEDLVERLESALKIWGVDYPRLTIEITESALLTDPTKTFSILKKLKNLGIKISIDDFGTGYSSLSYFKNIPATELKVDQSFVKRILSSSTDLQITKTIISIAKEFKLRVVAEGIEDKATYDALTTLGCDVGQGYFIGRPMPMPKFIEWLKTNHNAHFIPSVSKPIDKPSQKT